MGKSREKMSFFGERHSPTHNEASSFQWEEAAATSSFLSALNNRKRKEAHATAGSSMHAPRHSQEGKGRKRVIQNFVIPSKLLANSNDKVTKHLL